MRIAIVALGTRGDVQPYIALGKGLATAGHTIRLATHPNYKALVTAHGLDFWPVKGDVQEVAESEAMRALLEKGNFLAITRYTAKEAQRAALDWARDGLAACQGMDLIVAGLGGLFIGLSLAEKLDLPLVQAYLVPFSPTGAYPSVLLPASTPRLGPAFNRLSHRLTRQVMWQGARSGDKAARQQVLGLTPAPFWGPFNAEHMRRGPVLFGFSPAVIPPPADWDANQHVTGYWFLKEEAHWAPPPGLEDFLAGDPTPVYIGFGSMSNRNPKATAALVLQALERTGQRAVLLSGWGGLRQDHLPANVMMVSSIPHTWLFPRVAAVIHHGGAGTTAAGLRAGVPSIIIPFFGDQPFWGQRIAELGVGPAPIARKALTAERLAKAIQIAVSGSAMRQRAADLGATIRAEDGIGRAVDVIQTLAD